MKTLGVLGGMSPVATAYFMELVALMTKANSNKDYFRVITDSNPIVPNGQKYIVGLSDEDPYPYLKSGVDVLKGLGADIIAIPYNTSQYFRERLEKEVGVPIINLVKETAIYLQEKGIKKAGVISAPDTVATGVYQNTLAEYGIEPIIPSDEKLKNISHIIECNIKVGLPPELPRFKSVSKELRENGAEVVIIGGTELSIVKRGRRIGHGYVDAMEVLAYRAIVECGAEVWEGFDDLIS